ncbi:MAG: pentapeptide repeat-containing protein [Planctomycetaceae bacterium]|nr:pentapeptide repeat-containing protein [Planctomycetaceae bacterium]
MNTARLPAALIAIAATLLPAGAASADEPARTYKRDFSNGDLRMRAYDGQDLSETNFENSDLFLAGFRNSTLTRSNFQGCNLKSSSFDGADLTECDLRFTNLEQASIQGALLAKANLAGLDVKNCSFLNSRLPGANLAKARGFTDLRNANLSGADVRGADFTRLSAGASGVVFNGALYDQHTRWPSGFDPAAAGAKYVETPAEVVKPAAGVAPAPASPAPGGLPMPAVDPAAEFAKLDGNADGVLSGKEAKPFPGFDANQDGDITKDEFVAARAKQPAP